MTRDRLLDVAEIEQLTKKKRFSAQRKALDVMGISHWVRPDGSPAVSAAALSGDRRRSGAQPNFAALEG